MPNGVYLTGFFSNYPTRRDMDAIFAFLNEHAVTPRYGARYAFADIRQACTDLDSGRVNGKIIVTM